MVRGSVIQRLFILLMVFVPIRYDGLYYSEPNDIGYCIFSSRIRFIKSVKTTDLFDFVSFNRIGFFLDALDDAHRIDYSISTRTFSNVF